MSSIKKQGGHGGLSWRRAILRPFAGRCDSDGSRRGARACAQMDALDVIEAADDDREFTREVETSECRAALFAQITDRLLVRGGERGNLGFHREGEPIDDVGCYLLNPVGQRATPDQP